MTAEQAWDFYCPLLRGPEIDQLKTDNAPLMKRLVFPFEFSHDKKEILKDREKIFKFAKHFYRQGEVSKMMEDAAYSWGLVVRGARKTARREFVVAGFRITTTNAPTHFLVSRSQSARDVADDGSTEGGITESLAMMNGEVTKSLMTSSLIINAAGSKNSRTEQIAFLYLHACLGLR